MGFIKIKNLCSAKDTVKKIRQTRLGENTRAVSNKGLPSKIYKELVTIRKQQFNRRKGQTSE